MLAFCPSHVLPLTKNPPLKRFHVAHADRNDSKKNNQLIC